jgi:hypothetical protein
MSCTVAMAATQMPIRTWVHIAAWAAPKPSANGAAIAQQPSAILDHSAHAP